MNSRFRPQAETTATWQSAKSPLWDFILFRASSSFRIIVKEECFCWRKALRLYCYLIFLCPICQQWKHVFRIALTIVAYCYSVCHCKSVPYLSLKLNYYTIFSRNFQDFTFYHRCKFLIIWRIFKKTLFLLWSLLFRILTIINSCIQSVLA